MNNKTKLFTILTTAIISVSLTVLFFVSPMGVHFFGILSGSSVAADYGKLMKIERYIDTIYMGAYDPQSLADGAVKGYVNTLGDPYSGYFNKKEFEDLNEKLDGEYQGIGITIKQTGDRIGIKEVTPNSPAEKAGLKPEDVITAVNGKSYDISGVNEAINVIKSTKIGGSVSLTIERNGTSMNVNIVVQKVHQELVKGQMLDNSVGYIYISTFGKSAAEAFSEKISQFKTSGMKGLVIDLRNNPGGTLESAVEIADLLLPEGKIVTVRDKHGREEVYTSDKEMLDIPVSVIVNENSASASEVLSGALRDNSRGTLVGKKTFGKGVVQSVIDLGDGSGLSLTIAKYYTPSDICINGIGIEPDIIIEPSADWDVVPGEISMKDTQLNGAIAALGLE